jgi:hypothetical protein
MSESSEGTNLTRITVVAERPLAAGEVEFTVLPNKFGDTDPGDNTAVLPISVTK